MIFDTRSGQQCFGGHKVGIWVDLQYLDVIFSTKKHYHHTRKHIVEQARKAIHALFIANVRKMNCHFLWQYTALRLMTYKIGGSYYLKEGVSQEAFLSPKVGYRNI